MSNATRTELVEQLRKLGVETVTAHYDGSDDNGIVDDPAFVPIEVPGSTVMAVQDLFYDVLEEHYGGWEINEGGFGQFTWDVRGDRINLIHNARIESIDTEEQDL